jgi:hypothetical protein
MVFFCIALFIRSMYFGKPVFTCFGSRLKTHTEERRKKGRIEEKEKGKKERRKGRNDQFSAR